METNFRILIVDDDADFCASIKENMEEIGYTVKTAVRGREAVSLCEKDSYDIAIIDIRLPDISGIEVIRKIRIISPSTEFIYITAYASLDSAIEAVRQEHVISYETKPLDMDHLLSVLKQINKRKKAEEQIRKLTQAVEQSPVTVLITDTYGNIEYTNPKFTQLTGYTSEEVYLHNPRILKSGRTPSAVYKELWETIKSGKEWRGKFCNKKKNGELYWEFAVISPVKNLEGVTTHFIAVKEDITERKCTEEALRRSEKNLNLIYDTVVDVLFQIGVERNDCFRFLSINRAGLNATGLTEKQIVGKRIEEVIPAPSHALVLDKYKEAVRDKKTVKWEDTSTYPAGEKIGEVTITPAFNEDGVCTHLIGSVHDITKRKQMEEELMKYQHHLESLVDERRKELKASQEKLIDAERLAVLGKLSGGIAHEIRNPLATIDISALNLKMRLKDADEKTKKYIDLIIKQVKETTDTIQSLQDLAKLEVPKKDRFDIYNIIEDEISASVIPQGVKIVNKVSKDNLFLDIDGKQITIVFRNILSNAVQAMDNEGTIWITACRAEDGWVDISIRDTGHGIAPENLEKIFQLFFGTKVRGFGYGLTICKMIMERHGGMIDVRSEVGKGSTFIIRFPSTG
jgi:two-component system, NtrC family, sensor kinase